MRETYTPVILQGKATQLRKSTGNIELHSKYDEQQSPLAALSNAISRPTKLLIFCPIVWSLSIYCAIVWGLLILLFTTFPAVYSEQYGFSQGLSGLSFIGMSVGMAVGAVGFGLVSDRLAKKRSNAQGKKWSPESRLLPMMWFAPVLPVSFFWYGWSAHYKAHWILPILGTTFIGLGALFIMVSSFRVEFFLPLKVGYS